MISFENDYNVGMHKKILEELIKTNEEPLTGYGNDKYCESARKKIKKACGNDNIEICFLSGGTQTNVVAIDSLLKSYEGVICASTGHINVHEAGAVEFTGHKVFGLPSHNGKLDAKETDAFFTTFEKDENNTHMVYPKMVYISLPSEYGTVYTKEELINLSNICHKHHAYLYVDGARLGYALVSDKCDVTLNDLTLYADAFYIGATKVGGIIGEALVYKKENAPSNMVTIIKQHLALLAKGRLIGIQFDALFTDNLYLEISKNAIETSKMLVKAFKENNYEFYLETETNQTFIILDKKERERLSKFAANSFFDTIGEKYVIRFVTSFMTKKEDVEEFITHLEPQKR